MMDIRVDTRLDRAAMRPDLQPHAVAQKRVTGPWPEKYSAAIARARNQYDQGYVELVHGRVGQMVTLYAIPRQRRVERAVAYRFSQRLT